MAITRDAKEKAVTKLSEELGRIKLAVMTDYRGLTVGEVEELRSKLRAEGISYRVTKNTLLRLAVGQNDAAIGNHRDVGNVLRQRFVAIGFVVTIEKLDLDELGSSGSIGFWSRFSWHGVLEAVVTPQESEPPRGV